MSNKRNVGKAFKIAKPEVVVHAASLTDVDKCETNKRLLSELKDELKQKIQVSQFEVTAM